MFIMLSDNSFLEQNIQRNMQVLKSLGSELLRIDNIVRIGEKAEGMFWTPGGLTSGGGEICQIRDGLSDKVVTQFWRRPHWLHLTGVFMKIL